MYTTMSKWSECAHASGVWRVCARALAHAAFTRGVGVNAWRRACLKRGADNFSSANGGVSQSDRLMQIPNPVHATPEKYVIRCCNYDGASAPRFRQALRQALTTIVHFNFKVNYPFKSFTFACQVPIATALLCVLFDWLLSCVGRLTPQKRLTSVCSQVQVN